MGKEKIRNKTKDKDYVEILTSGDDPVGAIMFMTRSNFSFNLNYSLSLTDDMKIESQCNFYRLCSPNYSGLFDFNLAKNGGYSSFMEVDCTYKPVSPFIRVTPEFSFLYGTNYKDGRGLICGGDFSLPIISEAWIRYEQNNKNYALIFARDIQNLDVAQRQERFKEPFELGAGIVGAGAAGAVAGSKAGPYGAIAGAVIGVGAGAVGGALDAQLAQERRAEAKDYMIDKYNMNLANIKAIPNSLTKNSAFTITNKIFPFLEFYTCTDVEKEALQNKIKYNGMTVGRIGYMTDYMSIGEFHYFKGQIIRGVGIEEDSHFLSTLYEEIAKGVYI